MKSFPHHRLEPSEARGLGLGKQVTKKSMVRNQPPAPGSDLGVEGTDTHIITTLLSGSLTVRPARATGHLEGGGEAARPRAPGKRVKAANSRQTERKAATAAHSWRLLCSCSPGSCPRRHLSSPPPKSIPSPLTQHLRSRRLPPRSTQAQAEASITALSGAFPLQACISPGPRASQGHTLQLLTCVTLLPGNDRGSKSFPIPSSC